MALICAARDWASMSFAMTMFSTFTAGIVSDSALLALTAGLQRVPGVFGALPDPDLFDTLLEVSQS